MIEDSGDYGVSVQAFDYGTIDNNIIINPAVSVATNKMGVNVAISTGTSICENRIEDNLGTAAMLYGISGGNGCVSCRVQNNDILGYTSLGIRQFQQASNTNTFLGNKTGADNLTGTITLTAGTTTVISNDNINFAAGYTSYIRLQPLSAASAAIVPYVSA